MGLSNLQKNFSAVAPFANYDKAKAANIIATNQRLDLTRFLMLITLIFSRLSLLNHIHLTKNINYQLSNPRNTNDKTF